MTILGKSLGRMSAAEKMDMRNKLKIELAQENSSKNGVSRYGTMIQCGFVTPVSRSRRHQKLVELIHSMNIFQKAVVRALRPLLNPSAVGMGPGFPA